eukprot:UN00138
MRKTRYGHISCDKKDYQIRDEKVQIFVHERKSAYFEPYEGKDDITGFRKDLAFLYPSMFIFKN